MTSKAKLSHTTRLLLGYWAGDRSIGETRSHDLSQIKTLAHQLRQQGATREQVIEAGEKLSSSSGSSTQ